MRFLESLTEWVPSLESLVGWFFFCVVFSVCAIGAALGLGLFTAVIWASFRFGWRVVS